METAAIGIGREYNEVSVIVAHWYNNNNNKWGVAHSLACFGIVLIPFKREEKKNGRNPDLIYIIFRFPYIFFLMSSIPHIIIATWKEEKKERKINIHIDSSIQTPQVFFLSLVVSHGSSFAACRRRCICFII